MLPQKEIKNSKILSNSKSRSFSEFWKLVALALGFVMATLDATVVNIAGANVQENFHLSLSGLTWVVDGYVLTFASLLLIAGTLSNRYGAKTVYLSGLMFFVIASILCVLSQNGDILILGRLLQGVGAALFMPSSLSLLAYAYSDEKTRFKMIGLWSSIVAASSGLGPFIGGILVNTFGWKSIFLINLPIGITGFIMTIRIIKQPSCVIEKVNFLNHFFMIITLVSLSFGLIQGPSYGWTSSAILSIFFVALISSIFFIISENRSTSPIIPTVLYRDYGFSCANLIGFLLNFSLFGTIFMFGLFLQKARGSSSFLAGIELLPIMAMFVLGNILFTRIVGRVGTRLPMLLALLIASIGSFLLVLITTTTPYWLLAVIFAITNLGVGITVPAMTATLIQSAGRTHANMASAVLNANRQIGALVGIAITGVVLEISKDWYQGAHRVFLVAGIAYLLACIIVLYFMGKIKEK